jgi:hypothetical protein
LNSPDARPASSWSTYVVAISVIGTKNRPMPIEVEDRDAGEEQPPAPEQVARAPTEQQEAADTSV